MNKPLLLGQYQNFAWFPILLFVQIGLFLVEGIICKRCYAQRLGDLFARTAEFRVEENRSFGDFGGDRNMHFLSTCWVGSELWAYYIEGPNACGIGLAKSLDGINFSRVKQVIGPGNTVWDNKMRSFPGVWKDGSIWYLVFETSGNSNPGDIWLATSTDGINWNIHPSAILSLLPGRRQRPYTWERNNIGTPSLYKEGGTWYLFYHGYGVGTGESDDCQIGVAYGTDLYHLKRYKYNPIIRTSNSGYDAGTVGKRSVIKDGEWYYMVYEVSTDAVPIPGEGPFNGSQWSSSVARAKGLFGPWEKLGKPVLPVTGSGMGYDGPGWIRTPDGKIHIYFRTPGNITRRATLVKRNVLIFQAERDLKHLVGRLDADGWSANTRDDTSNFMCYGPYTTAIAKGSRTASFRLMIDNNTAGNAAVVTLDIYNATAHKILASRVIYRKDFLHTFQYQSFDLSFISSTPNVLEFRTYWLGRAYIRQDSVIIR